MEDNKQQNGEQDKDITRSQNQQKQNAAGRGENMDAESRPEGAQDTGTGLSPQRSTKEAQYDKQSDDPTMHPSSADEDKG